MNTRIRNSIRIALATALIGGTQCAMAYTIDGNISDWGVYATGHASDWTPNSGVEYAISDQNTNSLYNGNSTDGYVVNYSFPHALGYGDQPYDAEAIYLDYDSTYLYYAVVTGRPEGVSQYPSGDIAFDFGSDGSWEYGIETRGNNGYNKGDLVQVSNWALGAIYPEAGVTEIQGGSVVSSNDFVYGSKITDIGQYTYYSDDDHYVMEGRIALSDFSLYAGQNFTVHWTMGCGNDEIHLASTLPTGGGGCSGGNCGGGGSEVPVPGTGLLFGSALIGWTLHRRRQQVADPESTESDEV
ncbi:MAG: PEP-CTERM sorting domain-containing protein [Gammaproteobacteria bacterium]|nr:PEP-CTERM sorting domain-containing protein [Gammaproteobacteria bacterium]MCP5137532.1 PEP-CTERM sorting domain-containing protein [Gammaproteobacteria bacterium]